jgi:aminoglycoside phosphotransferase (APT) family kinase protein
VSTLGPPDGYLQRQVSRFADLWPIYTTRDLPQVQELTDWLKAHLPDSRRAG